MRKESFVVIFQFMCRFSQVQASNAINAFILWWVCIFLITIGSFLLIFPLPIFWDAVIMRFHGVDLLRRVVVLDGLGALVAAGAGFLFFKWALRDVLFVLFLNHFALFVSVPGSMKYASLFHTGRRIAQIACIDFLALSSAALLRVGWRGGSSSLFLPSKTGMVGFCMLIFFGRCSSFIDCLCDIHALEYIVCLLVGPSFKIPSLYVGLFFP